jgi:hypothetical protein
VFQQPDTIFDMQRYDRNDPDPAVRLRIRVERTIVRCALRNLVAAGYSVAFRTELGLAPPTREPERAMEAIMQSEPMSCWSTPPTRPEANRPFVQWGRLYSPTAGTDGTSCGNSARTSLTRSSVWSYTPLQCAAGAELASCRLDSGRRRATLGTSRTKTPCPASIKIYT